MSNQSMREPKYPCNCDQCPYKANKASYKSTLVYHVKSAHLIAINIIFLKQEVCSNGIYQLKRLTMNVKDGRFNKLDKAGLYSQKDSFYLGTKMFFCPFQNHLI